MAATPEAGKSDPPPIVILLDLRGVKLGMQAKEVSGYESFRQYIQSKFNLDPQDSFIYSVAEHVNFKLNSENDFAVMLVLATMSAPCVVQIAIDQSEKETCNNFQTPITAQCKNKTTLSEPILRSIPTLTVHSTPKNAQYTAEDFHLETNKTSKPMKRKHQTTVSESSSSNNKPNTSTYKHPVFQIPMQDGDYEDYILDGNYETRSQSERSTSTNSYHLTDEEEVYSDFDDDTYSQLKEQERKDRRYECKKRSKLRVKEREITGEWFPGATTHKPTYDISRKQRHVTLMSDGWLTCIKGIGQEFHGGAEQFRSELAKYASKRGFHYDLTRNEAKYITAVCKLKDADDCQWFVQGSVHPITKHLFIKDANLSHTCRLSVMRNDTKRMGSRLIGQIIQEQIIAEPTTKPMKIKKQLLNSHGFCLDYMKVWRGVEVARANIYGTYTDSFDHLRWYSHSIHKRNPGSVTALETQGDTNVFKRFFFAFKASIDGFKHCRPMLFIDGTFMKNRYKGTLLCVSAKDGNNGIFPIAMAIVSSENTENWVWFLNLVIEHVQHHQQIIYVSDRAGGILAAFDIISQKPYHFYCLWHLMKNLRDKYGPKLYTDKHRNTMAMLLKNLAYAPNVRLFEQEMIPFLKLGQEIASRFLLDLPRERWAVAYSPDLLRYGELTSSSAEAFNAKILEARSLNINYMVDTIRGIMMKWFLDRKKAAHKHPGALTPAKEEKWDMDENISSTWDIQMSEDGSEYEVLSIPSAIVDLEKRTCTCWTWQIQGFPCCHAVAVITRGRRDIRDYIEPCFFTESLRKVYDKPIHPIPTTDMYEFPELATQPKILPPVNKQVPGRPQVKRFQKEKIPRRKQYPCESCGQMGRHHWTTCGERMHEPHHEMLRDFQTQQISETTNGKQSDP